MSRQHHPVPHLKRDDALYLAGLIDGEGCFFMGRAFKQDMAKKYAYSTEFRLVLVDEPTIAWAAAKLGQPYSHQDAKPDKNHRDTYAIRITQVDVLVEFVPQILPFLRTKRAVATKFLEYCMSRKVSRDLKYNAPYTETELSLYDEIKALNRVGILATAGGQSN